MRGCLGCLGWFLALALLLRSIQTLAAVDHWPDGEAGLLGLVVGGLLVVSHRRRRAAPRANVIGDPRHGSPARSTARADRGMGPAWERRRPRSAATTRRPVERWGVASAIPAEPARSALTQAQGRGAPPAPSGPSGTAARRARDPIPAQLRFGVLQRDGFRCRYCGRTSRAEGVVLHVDHVVPVASGGATNEDNLLTACEECNLGKSTRAVVPAGS